jgi:CheY-like chemotaxis protein/predicted regulator of Ras-like GTPase activity (Roadblock/LC7/MglB family)
VSTYTVLIVDDQRDVRRLLRTGLETMRQDISVVDVPSGEEAILVISQQIIDLLIADVRLPGISGLELKERAQIRNPDLKFFLITGIQDQKTRKEVVNAGADAYFFKPVEMSDFLEAVRKSLKFEEESFVEVQEKPVVKDVHQPLPGISQILSRLRQELDVVCAVLISENGQLMVQAGSLPDEAADPNVMASMMATFGTASKVSYMLSSELPKNILYFSGKSHEFFLTHVGQSLGLLVVLVVQTWDAENLWKLITLIRSAVQDFQKMVSERGAPLVIQVVEPLAPNVSEMEEEPVEEGPLANMDDVLKKVKIKPKEADKFWENAMEESSDEVHRTDALSYEQARQLGLTPSEGET